MGGTEHSWNNPSIGKYRKSKRISACKEEKQVSTASQPVQQRTNIAWIIIVASGVVAGLHIWKLAPALPVIQEQLGFSLLFAGTLLGVVQVAGMIGGLAVSLLSEVISQRRTLLLGLLLLVSGSALGGTSQDAYFLLETRIIEGAGVIMTTVMTPGAGSFARTVEGSEHGCRLVGGLHGHGDVHRSLQYCIGPAAHVMEHLVVDPGRNNTAAASTGVEVRGSRCPSGCLRNARSRAAHRHHLQIRTRLGQRPDLRLLHRSVDGCRGVPSHHLRRLRSLPRHR